MVRLSADLILRSPQYFNAVREREVDLRGNSNLFYWPSFIYPIETSA